MRLALLVLVLGLCASCIDLFHREWVRVESPIYVDPELAYRLELPKGWALSGGSLTRDGQALQWIRFGSTVLDKEERALWRSEVPTEESVRAMELLPPFPDLRVLDVVPATVAGRPGLRVHGDTENPAPWVPAALFAGLEPHRARAEAVTYAVLVDDTLYTLSYRAPALHYFARDLPAFERLVASFELLDPVESARGAAR